MHRHEFQKIPQAFVFLVALIKKFLDEPWLYDMLTREVAFVVFGPDHNRCTDYPAQRPYRNLVGIVHTRPQVVATWQAKDLHS
jgi:hypothetical protein